MSKKGFRFSRLSILHLKFLYDLHTSGSIDERVMVDLAASGLDGICEEAKEVIFPITPRMISIIYSNILEGRNNISIYSDKIQRYICADYSPRP
jgi:hypothetical protein